MSLEKKKKQNSGKFLVSATGKNMRARPGAIWYANTPDFVLK